MLGSGVYKEGDWLSLYLQGYLGSGGLLALTGLVFI